MTDKKTVATLTQPVEYNQRNVMVLKAVSQWTPLEQQQQFEHNRILQDGFLNRSATALVDDAKLLKEEWLTDILCPSVKANFMLNIARDLVVKYKVDPDALDNANHEIFSLIEANNTNLYNDIESAINSELSKGLTDQKQSTIEALEAKNEVLRKNGKKEIEINDNSISAMSRVIHDRLRKEISNRIIDEHLANQMPEIATRLGLQEKERREVGANKDVVMMGAAGSGKSTTLKQTLRQLGEDGLDKNNFVILSTDNYRAFTMPNTHGNEAKRTKNVFIRTQDVAYLIKEKVLEELSQNKAERANVIFDIVTIEPGMRRIMKTSGELHSTLVAYSGEPGFKGIAERAHSRAIDENASAADKGRFVNTTALLSGHAIASARILGNVPSGVITDICSSNVERGQDAVKIASIDDANKVFDVYDLRQVSEFLNKRNINEMAVNQVDLIMPKQKSSIPALATNPDMKAKAILDLIPKTPFKPSYTLNLRDDRGDVYASLRSENGNVAMDVQNPITYESKLNANTIESQVLKAMERQIKFGSLDKSMQQAINETLEISAKDGDAPKEYIKASKGKWQQKEEPNIKDTNDRDR